jgi:hypothetical protein
MTWFSQNLPRFAGGPSDAPRSPSARVVADVPLRCMPRMTMAVTGQRIDATS